MGDLLSQILLIFTSIDFYAAVLRLTTPILLVAMGSIFCERAGIMNIAVEGFMLMGAMTAVVVTYYLGNPWLGAVGAMAAGLVLSAIFAIFVVYIGTDHIVTAVALNLFSMGATSLIFRQIFGAMSRTPEINGLPTWKIPILSNIPVAGDIFFEQSPLVYLAFLSIPVANFVLYHTKWGLNIRAVGETPRAADSVGLNVLKIRLITTLVSGAVSGLAGAFLSIGQTTIFQEGMTAGRGFIAYTAIVFGKWNPLGAMAGSLLFGFADALQLRIQALGIGIPYQFALMIPYLFTIFAIVFAVGRVSWSAAYGQPYRRIERSID